MGCVERAGVGLAKKLTWCGRCVGRRGSAGAQARRGRRGGGGDEDAGGGSGSAGSPSPLTPTGGGGGSGGVGGGGTLGRGGLASAGPSGVGGGGLEGSESVGGMSMSMTDLSRGGGAGGQAHVRSSVHLQAPDGLGRGGNLPTPTLVSALLCRARAVVIALQGQASCGAI